MFYIHVNLEVLKLDEGLHAIKHKSIKQSYVSSRYYERDKKAVLLFISHVISMKEKLCKEMNVEVDFRDKAMLI